MTPNPSITTGVLDETEQEINHVVIPKEVTKPKPRKYVIVWWLLITLVIIHSSAFYGIYLGLTSAKWLTLIFDILILYPLGAIGVTAGTHRLFSHRSYKAKLPLRILLVSLSTMTFQNKVIKWARDHRVHHKYTDTDADPYNAKRGLFYSHLGWSVVRRHEENLEKINSVDISDLQNDPVVAFENKYYYPLALLIALMIPTAIPMYFWGETFWSALCINSLRQVICMHSIFLINSLAHAWGTKPFNKYITPSENLFVGIAAMGEGWHNYHHTFPWDYKASELGQYSTNLSTAFIDLMAKIGWAYDLKTVSESMVRSRITRTGDGSHPVWGWGDGDQKTEDVQEAVVMCKKYE